jgi:hypothetical protein
MDGALLPHEVLDTNVRYWHHPEVPPAAKEGHLRLLSGLWHASTGVFMSSRLCRTATCETRPDRGVGVGRLAPPLPRVSRP